MVPDNIYLRVLRIVVGFEKATAFTIERNGIQFLVTAKHIFALSDYPSYAGIDLLFSDGYKAFNVEVRYPDDPDVDIAVMKICPYQEVTAVFNNQFSTEGVIYGQDVFFVGFPFEYDKILDVLPESENPMPFIKKACFSASVNNFQTILLDGHNNPGFSGAPVCFKKYEEKTGMSILGVVTGFVAEDLPIYDQTGKKTDFFVQSNTGIIIVADIKHAIAIADQWTE